MRKYLLVLAPVILCCYSLPHTTVSSASLKVNQAFAVGEVLVQLREGSKNLEDAIQIVDGMYGGRSRIEELSSSGAKGAFLIRFDRTVEIAEVMDRLSADPQIEFAEPNYVCYAAETVPNDPFFDYMWALNNVGPDFVGTVGADVGVIRAWDITTGNRDIVVAVTDTGVDLSHPDLEANAWTNTQEIAGNGIDDDRNGYVDDVHGWNFLDSNNQYFQDPEIDGHGTHVAGTIGAVGNNELGVTGVAWRVQLMALKFLDGIENRGFISNAVKAINYVIGQKRAGVNVQVINASWVSPHRSRSLREAIRAAGEAGILFVCAAGNEGFDIDEDPIYPAAYGGEIPSLLPVAALDRFDRLESYSNYGFHTVSVGAPGSDVLGLAPLGEYGGRSGTSMAAPHVSGVAVLLWSHEPALTAAEVKQRIISTSDPVPELGAYCAGSGRVNAFNALTGRIVPPPLSPVIGRIEATKTIVTVDGHGFLSGSSVIEINGVGYSGTSYKKRYLAPNGKTLTRLTMKPGRELIKERFPLNVDVAVTVFNSTTGERSNTFHFRRAKGSEPQ